MAWTKICIYRWDYWQAPIGGLLLTLVCLPVSAALSLEQTIKMAQQNDPWLQGSEYRQRALEAESTAARALPDPLLSLGLANLPTDTFEFDQEAMTQFKVGVTQTIPRGRSLALKQRQLATLGNQQPLQREDRKAKVAVTVSQLWLDNYRARETIGLIEADRELFDYLVDVAQSSYSTAVGKTRQQDLVRAQLELTRLEDRLTVLYEDLEISRSRLEEWVLPGGTGSAADWQAAERSELAAGLPALQLVRPDLIHADLDQQGIATQLVAHPAILDLDAKIAASATGEKIAEQSYKPEWKVNASYGYRDDAPNGMERSDFFSVGLAFDVPLFTAGRQDQFVRSAIASTEAVRTERTLLLRTMMARFTAQRARLLRLEQRRELYQTRLLREMHAQSEASLVAYTNDDGDFAEVVRSRIDELNARIDAFGIEVDRLKTIARLNYFFTRSEARPLGVTP